MHSGALNRDDRSRPPAADVAAEPLDGMLSTVLDQLGPSIMRGLLARYKGLLREEDARDILAITAARAWSARLQFDPAKGTLAAWIRTIAHHAAANEIASGFLKCRCRERECSSAKFDAFQDHGPALGDDEANEEPPSAVDRRALIEILEALPPAHRLILMADACCPNETADTRALARELGLAPASIRVYRLRAKQSVRAEWERRGLPIPGGRRSDGEASEVGD